MKNINIDKINKYILTYNLINLYLLPILKYHWIFRNNNIKIL